MGSTYNYYFLSLRREFRNYENNREIRISMNDLANIFFCTHRNVKIIINKLVDENLILFTSGRGRGKTSTIIFLEDFNNYLLRQTEVLINEGEVNKALELVKEFGEETEVKDYLIRWISQYFGYKKIYHSDEGLDLDVLRFPIYRPITTIDPSKVFFDFDAHLIMQVFNTLVKYDVATETFHGSLAHAWESNDLMTKWLFFLRKGIKFHNGKELTANDVKNSILRLRNSPHKWLVEDIFEIEVKSKYSILFLLNKPNRLFLHYLSYTPTAIIDASHPFDDFHEIPIGTGPFKIEKIQPDSCNLAAFDSYFQSRSHLDRVEIIRMADYLKDNLLEWQKLFLDTGETEKKEQINLKESTKRFSGTNVLTLNTKKDGPLQNEKFRQFLNTLIDREELLQIGEPRLTIANGFHLNNLKRNINQQNLITQPLFFSKELLESIGYNGEILTLTTYQRHAKDATCIQKKLQEYGVHLTVNIVDWAYIQRDEILNDSDMILFEGTPNEGVISLFDLLFYEQGFIYPFLTEELKKEIERYANRIKTEEDLLARLTRYEELEKFLIAKGVIIFLVHKIVDISYDPSLEGVKVNSRMWVDFNELWYKHFRL